ncbi:hypothetical protein [Sporomusa acidovorans]|uniref:Uncharacterized protein n=1 Tax=Sporomusa acidovorans (strain ATCC 49682 / DSM 3132 / Mol) TaxID=1123286 RepID=A0ABZ3J469_SPOA4|nr:hypothetical protein [Sporomusa acidovorans]OZC15564.1 hypothetical protein SPACI_48680 [Sporomusa acidovorans DSM 3132]SDE18436.1 myo-inositol-1(or 4)-monophosphatase [Sporomusa acidovorans]
MEPDIDLGHTLARLKVLVKEIGLLQKENLGKVNLAIDVKSTAIDIVTEIDKKRQPGDC